VNNTLKRNEEGDKNMTTEEQYEVILIDDGTLDTVISVDGVEYRYNYDPNPDGDESYDDFVEWAIKDAIEHH
tara:strand:- start:528 stop:743 length:216 start_codon:yes stop_codon:yes gene_type:complete